MIAYQPVDPSSGLSATRMPLAQIVGLFLCRRTRPSFGPAALIDLFDEFRTIVCDCGTQYDLQLLTAEKTTNETADVTRSGICPHCAANHASQLQFQRNGLIVSKESDGWYVWLSPVKPNRLGNAMEEHLFWYLVDWTRRNSELAYELNVPEEKVQAWRRKVGKSKSTRPKKSRAPRTSRSRASRPRTT